MVFKRDVLVEKLINYIKNNLNNGFCIKRLLKNIK